MLLKSELEKIMVYRNLKLSPEVTVLEPRVVAQAVTPVLRIAAPTLLRLPVTMRSRRGLFVELNN